MQCDLVTKRVAFGVIQQASKHRVLVLGQCPVFEEGMSRGSSACFEQGVP